MSPAPFRSCHNLFAESSYSVWWAGTLRPAILSHLCQKKWTGTWVLGSNYSEATPLSGWSVAMMRGPLIGQDMKQEAFSLETACFSRPKEPPGRRENRGQGLCLSNFLA